MTFFFRAMAFSCLVFILSGVPAWAAAPLIWRDAVRDAREETVIDYLLAEKKMIPALPYKIAAVDLNGDGVEEWIVRQSPSPACEVNGDCHFAVVGLSEKKPLLLGTFPARKIAISDDKAYGVHILLVYNNKNDDFTFTKYYWTPPDAAFLP